jgi:hypothetical protein
VEHASIAAGSLANPFRKQMVMELFASNCASARRGNADLWRTLDQACALRQVTFSQIKEGEIAVWALAEAEYEYQADRAIAWLPLQSDRQILGTYTGVAP